MSSFFRNFPLVGYNFGTETEPALFQDISAVFIGGLAALSVAIGGWYVFPKLRHLDRLADLCPRDELKIKGNKNDQQ